MANDKTIWIVLGTILAIALLYNYTNFGSIILSSAQVQYYNKPIEARFTTNLTDATIQIYFNNVKLTENVNNTELDIDIINGSYVAIYRPNITQEGVFKIVALSGNTSEVAVIEVKTPFVDSKNDIINVLDKTGTQKLSVTTFNPQGENLEADSVTIEVIAPDNSKQTLILDKSGNTFTKDFKYTQAGNYVFHIQAKKMGYNTIEKTAITNVLKEAGIHPILWVWAIALVLFIIFFIIARVRK